MTGKQLLRKIKSFEYNCKEMSKVIKQITSFEAQGKSTKALETKLKVLERKFASY